PPRPHGGPGAPRRSPRRAGRGRPSRPSGRSASTACARHSITNGPADFGLYAGSMPSDRVTFELKRLPAAPGVYLFRDEADDVLYVGKAKSLRSRVRQYFQAGRSDNRLGMDTLVARVARIETIVTGTEVEALHLEQNLVKRHRPPFNVRLRDDKSFPYIAVTLEDEYPRVMFTRKRHR